MSYYFLLRVALYEKFSDNINLADQIAWKISVLQCYWWEYWNAAKSLISQKFQLKTFKTLYKTQTVSHLKKIILPPTRKKASCLWNGNFLMDNRNVQTFSFQVLWECSSQASRNGAVLFFLRPSRNVIAEKFVKWIRFVAKLPKFDFYNVHYNVQWAVIHKMWGFWAKLYCKMSGLLC